MKFTLENAAKYVKGEAKASWFGVLLRSMARIFTFSQERTNRFRRFVAIVAAYRRGVPVSKIEAKYGCSKQTVLRYARMAGLDRRPRGIAPDLREKVLQDYRDGLSLIEIEARHGVSQQYISIQARKEGISRRKPWKKKR